VVRIAGDIRVYPRLHQLAAILDNGQRLKACDIGVEAVFTLGRKKVQLMRRRASKVVRSGALPTGKVSPLARAFVPALLR
jgi:hypothetical protein